MIILLAAIIAVLLLWWYWQTRQTFTFWSSRGVPGPRPTFPLGNTPQMLTRNRAHIDQDWIQQYGSMYGFYAGTQPVLCVSDAKLIKTILVKDFAHFMNRQRFNFYHEMWNENLFNASADKWKRIRTIATPGFTTGKLKAMRPAMERCIEKLVTYLDSVAKDSGRQGLLADTKEAISGFTVDVIASTSFATETNSNDSRAERSPFVQNGRDLFDVNRARAVVAFAFPRVFVKLIGLKTFFSPRPFQFFIDLSREIVQQRKRVADGAVKHHDFVQMLLDAYVDERALESVNYERLAASVEEKEIDDPQSTPPGSTATTKKTLTETEIIAQCFLFFIAGFETTASTLSVALYELCKHPEIQEQLHSVIETAIDGLEPNSDAYFDRVVNGIPLLDAVIKESLRLYPPFAVLFRRVTSDGYRLAGIPLPRGQAVEIAAYSVHHNPKYYPEPERFRPDRFLPENRHLLVPYTFLPFGDGPRNCVGMRFAYQEIKLLLARLLTRYRFERTEQTPERLNFQKGTPLLSVQTYPCRVAVRGH